MSRLRAIAAGASACAYPLFTHFAAVRSEPLWAGVGLALLAWAATSMRASIVVSAGIGLLTLLISVAVASAAPAVMVYAPPVALNLFLCSIFAASLRPRSVPLISRFAQLERGGKLPPDLVRYTRTLTRAWVAFFAVMGATSLALAVWGSVTSWSIFTNLANYLLVALFFLGEYVYRRLRYRHYDHATPLELARRIRKRGLFVRGNWS